MSADRRGAGPFRVSLLAPLTAGIAVRARRLGEQVLAGDELHGVRAALADPIAVLLTTYRTADPCLPLAAFYRWVLELGGRWSETGLRSPALAASLLAVLVLPLLARRWVGDRAAFVLAWLLALSPSLVAFGRMARPYAIVWLLAGVAVLCFYRWWRREGGSDAGCAAAYALLAPLVAYLHLPSASFVAAPFVFALADGLYAGSLGRRWRGLAAVGLAALAGVAAFALPARDSLLALLAAKSGAGGWSAEVLGPLCLLGAGTSHAWVAVVFWTLTALGAALLASRRPAFATYTLTLVAVHVAALLALAPFGVFSPLIVHRYLLVAAPLVLLWTAVGLAGAAAASARWLLEVAGKGWGKLPPWARGDRPLVAGERLERALAILLVGLALALWLGSGPLVRPAAEISSFQLHDDLLRFDRPLELPPLPAAGAPRVEAEVRPRLPALYLELEAPGALIEYPFRPAWRFARAPYLYQLEHRRRVLVSSLDPTLCDPRLAWSNHVCPRAEELLAAPARYLVVHLDPLAEERAVAGQRRIRDPRPRRWRVHAEAAARLAAHLEERWGAPDHATPGLVAWDLERARRVDESSVEHSR